MSVLANKPNIIRVAAGSELARLLAKADAGPLLLEKDGDLYRLDRVATEPENIWEGYDPERVREAIAATAGSWADLDADRLIADLYRAREEGSRPDTRPR